MKSGGRGPGGGGPHIGICRDTVFKLLWHEITFEFVFFASCLKTSKNVSFRSGLLK